VSAIHRQRRSDDDDNDNGEGEGEGERDDEERGYKYDKRGETGTRECVNDEAMWQAGLEC
jgi:hypothetical protein